MLKTTLVFCGERTLRAPLVQSAAQCACTLADRLDSLSGADVNSWVAFQAASWRPSHSRCISLSNESTARLGREAERGGASVWRRSRFSEAVGQHPEGEQGGEQGLGAGVAEA